MTFGAVEFMAGQVDVEPAYSALDYRPIRVCPASGIEMHCP
jgi:hypothetical protein